MSENTKNVQSYNLKCDVTFEIKEKDGKRYQNIFITTPNGTNFWVKLGNFNSKLLYKIQKEFEQQSKPSKVGK